MESERRGGADKKPTKKTSPTVCLGLSKTQPDCLDQHHLQNVLDCSTHNQIV